MSVDSKEHIDVKAAWKKGIPRTWRSVPFMQNKGYDTYKVTFHF